MARGFDDITPTSGNRDSLKIDEIVDIHKFEDGQYENIRVLPLPMLPVKMHWIKIVAGKEKREVKIPRLCVSFDPDNESVPKKGTHCPYCELTQGKDGACQTNVKYYANAIIRDLQDNEPRKKGKPNKKEKKSGYKEKGSKAWTPVRVVGIPNGLALKLKKLKQRNVYKGDGYSVAHPKNGCDVAILYDSNASASNAYTIDRGDRTPLTKEEKEYLVYDLSDEVYGLMGLMDTKQAKEDFKRMTIVGGTDLDDDDDDDDDMALGSKKKKKKAKKTSSLKDKKKKKKKSDDDDEKPKKKKKKKSSKDDDEKPKKKKKKSSKDDDGDKKKKKKKSKKASF